MSRRSPQRDPSAVYVRKALAERRVGSRKCACGESRPEVLIPGREPIICFGCYRDQRGITTFDLHHPAGSSNNPARIPIWVNDHVGVLTVLQYDWPKATLENPDSSPLLAAAGRNRGYIETNGYLVDTLLDENTEMIEALDVFLVKRLGPKWWVGTEMERFMPERTGHLPCKPKSDKSPVA